MASKIEYVSKVDGFTYRGKSAKAARARDGRIAAFKDGTSHQKPGSLKKHRR